MSKQKLAYIQMDPLYPKNTNYPWWSQNCEEAAIGLKQLGYEVSGFNRKDLKKLHLTKNTIVKGSVQTVRQALNILGVPQPKATDIPKSLRHHAHRKTWKSTVEEVIKNNLIAFVKPLNVTKAFGAFMYRGTSENRKTLRKFPGGFQVLCSEPIELIQEWRIYVLDKKILGTFVYSHSSYNLPSMPQVKKMIRDYKNPPIAYALDVGHAILNKKGTTKNKLVLVEVNSTISLGNYGLKPKTYAKMVEARWKEMVSG